MKTSEVFSVNIVGANTKRVYTGEFTTKTTTTMKDEFASDLKRRQVIGPSPDGTPPSANLQWQAYMIGQLFVKLTDAPKWWQDSNGGLDLEDMNVITEVYNAVLEAEDKVIKALDAESEEALEKLKAPPKKK